MRKKKFLKLLIKVLVFLFIPILLIFLSAYLSYEYTSRRISNYNDISLVNDPRIPKVILGRINKVIQPFDSVEKVDFNNNPNEVVTVSYGLDGFTECYIASTKGFDILALFIKSSKLALPFPPINWNNAHIKNSGYYQGEGCFAIYVNPYPGMTAENIRETAVYSEVFIRKVFKGNILEYKDKPLTDQVILTSFSDEQFGVINKDVLGIARRNSILLNTDFYQVKNNFDISWFVIHEMNHILSSGDLNVVSPSPYKVPNEALTEFAGAYMSRHIKNGYRAYSPAINSLLKYVSEEELMKIYYQGDISELKAIVDTKTYEGALCTYFYHLGMNDVYGYTESDVYDKAFLQKDQDIDPIYLNCIYE